MSAEIKKLVRQELERALGALGKQMTERMDKQDEHRRKLEERIDGIGDEKAAMTYRRAAHGAATSGNTSRLLSNLDDMPVEQAIAHLREVANGSTMFGDGIGRAHIPNGDTRGLLAVRMMRAEAIARRSRGQESALDIAGTRWKDKELCRHIEQRDELLKRARSSEGEERQSFMRALGTETLGAGASVIQTEMASNLLDILHAKTVVRKGGAITLPLRSGEMKQPFLEVGVEPTYENEGSGPNSQQPADGELLFQRKTLTVLVAVHNEWLEEASYSMDVILRDHMVRQMQKKEDIVFLRGDGLQNTPFGWSYYADLQGNAVTCQAQAAFAAASAADQVKEVLRVLTGLVSLVECNDVAMGAPGFVLPCRDKWGLIRIVDGNGNFVFANEMARGTLLGFPFYDTTQIPTTLDFSGLGADNESEIYFADFSSVAIAEEGGIAVDVFPDGTYKDDNGDIVSGISNRHTVIRAVAKHDHAPLYRGKEIARADQVTYGFA